MITVNFLTSVYVVLALLFSLLTAFIFGNEGYEAFVTIAIALGLLISWQLIHLAKLIFQSKDWVIVKLVGITSLVFFWFVSVATIALAISKDAFGSGVHTPSINWAVVLVGTLPFLVPRISAYRLNANTKNTIIGILASLYSIIVLYVAVIGYYDTDASYRSVILVLALQLQYLMSFVITRSNYLNQSHAYAVSLTRRLKIIDSEKGQYLILFIVGLPFILPLATVLLIISLS
ncbi:hypothetical protein IPL85_05840 [Candidatus Saccharibacteria bacterium]|nr:MAG: hypothetical protein IPL85_05840 [Candidatus Saccharibacteria bacterium]